MQVKKSLYCGVFIFIAVFAVTSVFADDVSDLKARAATWEKEFNAGNLEGVAALYAADGCRMPPNAEAVQGKEGVLANLKSSKDQGVAKAKIGVTFAETSGDHGWGRGTYELMGADGSHMDHGKWMNVSKKVDGKWMIQCDIWNSDMPLPMPKK